MGLTTVSLSQKTATHDGIEMKLMDENRNEYYYGEPFRVFIRMKNTKSTSNSYHKYGHGFNVKMELRDRTTGREIKQNADPWNAPIASGKRVNLKNQSPTGKSAYAPGEVTYFYPHMEKSFGSTALTDKEITGVSLLKYNLFAIPTGDYELTVEYYLYPSKKVLTVKHQFKIIDVPDALKTEFKNYINTTYYCNETRYISRKPYNINHTNSYEAYFKNAKTNIFKDYAMIDRTLLPGYRGITELELQRQRTEYFAYFTKIEQKDVGLGYVRLLPKAIGKEAQAMSKTRKQLSNVILQSKLNNSFGASELFINLSRQVGVIELVNKAQVK